VLSGWLWSEQLAEQGQTLAVHEHHAIHVLHIMLATNVQHFGDLLGIEGGRLFANDVLSSLSGSDYPLLSQGGRQGDVDGIDVISLQQGFVGAHGHRWRKLGNIGRAFIDEALGRLLISARYCSYAGIVG
jgi:hypothetical protein